MAPSSKHDDCPFKDVVFPTEKQTSEQDRMMDTRVGRLEGVVESLTRDIQEVSQNISMMGKEIGNFRETIGNALSRMRDDSTNQLNAVTDRLTASSKPQWQTISAFVALAITLLGMAGAVIGLLMSGQSQNVADLKRDTTIITERMFQSQYEKGKSDAFAAETSSHLAKLDTTLQREMSLMQQTTDSKISGLDDKLQMELRLDRKNLEVDIARITGDIQDLRSWRLNHASKGGEVDSELLSLNKQLKGIEDRMGRIESRHRDDINRIDGQKK